MKNLYLLGTLALLFLLSTPAAAVVQPDKPLDKREMKEAFKEARQEARAEWESLSRKEKRAERKVKKKAIKAAIKDYKQHRQTDLLLLVLITILLPPLGMFLHEGDITPRFWISLLLTLLFYVPGLIYTLIVILGEN